jgi:DNA-binding CsgD family transcriptional regulator
MGHQGDRLGDSPFSKWQTTVPSNEENVRLSAARARAMDEAGAEIARQLNGPLTALLVYVCEINQHFHLSQAAGNRVYLQQVIESALQQTERVCALVKQISNAQERPTVEAPHDGTWEKGTARVKDRSEPSNVMFTSSAGQKPLTRREREVLNLISAGYSNKQGALRMSISPRTFESHRAEAMRKLGARNTADLVRLALLHPGL